MPNVAEVIRDHVTLAVECVDRLYLNAYVPGLQRGPGVVAFLRQRGQIIASPTLFGEITNAFKIALQGFCSARGIPWIEFTKGRHKDEWSRPIASSSLRTKVWCWWVWHRRRLRPGLPPRTVEGRRVHFTFN